MPVKLYQPGKLALLKTQQGSKSAASKVKRRADPKQSARGKPKKGK